MIIQRFLLPDDRGVTPSLLRQGEELKYNKRGRKTGKKQEGERGGEWGGCDGDGVRERRTWKEVGGGWGRRGGTGVWGGGE